MIRILGSEIIRAWHYDKPVSNKKIVFQLNKN